MPGYHGLFSTSCCFLNSQKEIYQIILRLNWYSSNVHLACSCYLMSTWQLKFPSADINRDFVSIIMSLQLIIVSITCRVILNRYGIWYDLWDTMYDMTWYDLICYHMICMICMKWYNWYGMIKVYWCNHCTIQKGYVSRKDKFTLHGTIFFWEQGSAA